MTFTKLKTINSLMESSLDFHCHGIGRFDFTEIPGLSLQEIDDVLSQRKQQVILTIYLPKPNFEQFLELMDAFDKGRKVGKYRHIVGFGLEGPLLASHGGTPEQGVWSPEKEHWQALAACGRKGLVYNVLSPDAELVSNKWANKPNLAWIDETLLEGGILPAAGHFTKIDPLASAKALQTLFDVVKTWGQGATITDHLFNDMPHNFKHAWRTREEKARRNQELAQINIESWRWDNLEERLGVIPAVMIRNARKGLVKLCQNFDGEHVDLAIVKKAVELAGAENMIMMTDSIESKRLAGRQLHMQEGSTLLYQDQGIVAAGSQNVYQQIQNMFSIGLSTDDIELITHSVPSSIIQQQNKYHAKNADAIEIACA